MKYDLKYLSVPLPEEIQRVKEFGDFASADIAIDFWLTKELPQALKERLIIEKDVIKMMRMNEYPHSFAKADQMMRDTFQDYQTEELIRLKETGLVDWVYIDGEPYFQLRFLANLIKTNAAYVARLREAESNQLEILRKKELKENIEQMQKNGGRKVRTTIKATIQVKKEFERPGERVRVHLPLPKACQQQSEIEILAASPEATYIAAEDAPQRTLCFETILKENQTFTVEYCYVNRMVYQQLEENNVDKMQPSFDLEEQLPHIRFTPYLRNLADEIVGDESNPLKKARLIYDFVATKIHYSFMREYFTISNISEYAATNLKGDCGVQAILFITLCRIAGIPAKWQSGLYVSTHYTGCHDWAQFYIEPYGWLFADLSFGGGAYRDGDRQRWNHYFGNLDVFRMVANSEIQADFQPAKMQLRADPIDNQRGEFEYENEGLPYACLIVSQERLSMEELPFD